MAEVTTMHLDDAPTTDIPTTDIPTTTTINTTTTSTTTTTNNNSTIPETPNPSSPPHPPPPSRRDSRNSRERRNNNNDDRDIDRDRPPNRRSDYYDHRNRSPPGPPVHREYNKRRAGSPASPGYRDRRGGHSPPYRRSPPYQSFKRRREDGGYDGRRGGSPPHRGGGYGSGDRRFGYDHPGGYDRDMGGRPGYPDDRPRGRYGGRGYQGGHSDWEPPRGNFNDHANTHREGLMSYKQFIQELEDDVLPSEAESRYQEYKSEYITTQKKAYFDAHKGEDWLKDKYHPTNLIAVIERRNESARKLAKEFLHHLQNGLLDLGPGVTAPSSNKSGQTSNPNSEDESDLGGKNRRRFSKDTASFSAAPKAHPISSEHRRVQADVEQAQALVKKLDLEKGIEDNVLSRADNERTHRDKSHGGPVVIIRGSSSVKGLEGLELLDTLITYLWRIHGLDYYGMSEKSEAKGLRHVRAESKNSDVKNNGSEWEKKLDTRWQERLKSQDPLEIMTAKEKIDAAAAESLDPFVRKIRDEKYGWKYGCGAKGCTKLFHAAEFVLKHLKLKHPELSVEATSKVREDLYLQNYMNDEDAPGGIPIMQQSLQKDRPQRQRPGISARLKDNRREPDGRNNGGERFDRGENPENDGGGDDDQMFDSFGAQGLHAPFPSDIPPPPVLMPVPGAGPLGPFVPAPPEVAMRMLREQGGPSPFEGGGRNGRSGPQMGGPAPIIALPPSFRQDPRRLRSYQDLDAPEDEVTVIDYRSL